MARLSNNMVGALVMCGSMAGFSANDAVMKLVGPGIGLYQSVFLRGALLCLFFGAYAWFRGSFRNRPNGSDARIIAIRSFAEIGISGCILAAIFNMPIANATAILQFVPLAIVVAAHFVLGERCGPMRMLAILVGLIGVLIIIRPGTEGFNAYSLLALSAVFFVVLRDFASRRLSRNANSLFVTVVSAAVVTTAFGIASLAESKLVARYRGRIRLVRTSSRIPVRRILFFQLSRCASGIFSLLPRSATRSWFLPSCLGFSCSGKHPISGRFSASWSSRVPAFSTSGGRELPSKDEQPRRILTGAYRQIHNHRRRDGTNWPCANSRLCACTSKFQSIPALPNLPVLATGDDPEIVGNGIPHRMPVLGQGSDAARMAVDCAGECGTPDVPGTDSA